jgi:hypothetical protein
VDIVSFLEGVVAQVSRGVSEKVIAGRTGRVEDVV